MPSSHFGTDMKKTAPHSYLSPGDYSCGGLLSKSSLVPGFRQKATAKYLVERERIPAEGRREVEVEAEVAVKEEANRLHTRASCS